MTSHPPLDPSATRGTLTVGDRAFEYFRLDASGARDLEHLPYTVKILLENMLRGAATQPGSWWPDLTDWLAKRSGPDRPAPRRLGARGYAPLVEAPGTYVFDS